jgi:hypothetical protein
MEYILKIKWDRIDIGDRIETSYNYNPNFHK